jgi:glycosyltransferase involved in cell wall biosynthesis
MHILLMPSFYPSPRRPVTGVFFHEQADALRRRGHQVGAIAMPRISVTLEHVQRGGLGALPDMFGTSREKEYTDFPVYRMHWGWFPRPLPPIVAPLVAGAGLRAYDAYVRVHGRPDVIHAHNIFYGGHVAAAIRAKRGVPVVLTEHSTSYMEGLVIFPGQTGIIQRTLAGTDAALAVGSALARAIRQFAPESRPDVIGNIVNTERFALRDTPPVPPFTVCAIGTLEKRKDYQTLLSAFAKVFRGDDARLLIAGDGAERAELEKIAADLSLSAQVTFLGRLDRGGVRSLLAQSHALVSSSLVESFGVTLIEAMACGLPVIATRSGGPDDFVNDENGILVPTRDVNALADAMRRMRANYSAYDPARIRALCVERFSEEAVMSRLESIYAQVQRNG